MMRGDLTQPTEEEGNKNLRLYFQKFDLAGRERIIFENESEQEIDDDIVDRDLELLSKKVMKEIDDTEMNEQSS